MPRTGAHVTAVIIAALATVPAVATAGFDATTADKACAALTVRVPVHPGRHAYLAATHVRVRKLSCARAASIIRSGSFALTPAGPIFTTRGYHCTSPIGPPSTSARPYHCTRRASALWFRSR